MPSGALRICSHTVGPVGALGVRCRSDSICASAPPLQVRSGWYAATVVRSRGLCRVSPLTIREPPEMGLGSV